ncbi:hypothetical protein [Kribbella deserti]|uniref:Uncharacterized protein n=1 Tax=Kribbella deserti TaxID=1926257 RepID=A0ABV6QNA7_9ACTN
MSSTELVGPLPKVTFGGGPDREFPRLLPAVAYVPPTNTLDPRYVACTKHHVACDCREAEWAEYRAEHSYARREMQAAFDQILAGHQTWQWSDEGDTFTGCMCTGCQLARACHIWPTTIDSNSEATA